MESLLYKLVDKLADYNFFALLIYFLIVNVSI